MTGVMLNGGNSPPSPQPVLIRVHWQGHKDMLIFFSHFKILNNGEQRYELNSVVSRTGWIVNESKLNDGQTRLQRPSIMYL